VATDMLTSNGDSDFPLTKETGRRLTLSIQPCCSVDAVADSTQATSAWLSVLFMLD